MEEQMKQHYEALIERYRELLRESYRMVHLEMGETREPVKYVGTYVLRWSHYAEPEVAFAQIDDEWIDEAL